MNIRLNIKFYLCLALLVHVGSVIVAIHAVDAARAYWSHFVEGSIPYPTLFTFVVALAPWLSLLSIGVVLAGIVAAFRASELSAMRYLACVTAVTVGILCVTTVGLSQPMSVGARVMDKQTANPQGGANGRQLFHPEASRTSAAAASRRSP